MIGFGQAIILVLLGAPFLVLSVIALYWAAKSGQLKNLEKSARSIFDEEEPEGKQLDFFPNKNKSSK